MVAGCLLEGGKVSEQGLRRWRAMSGYHHQILVRHGKQRASNFYSPAQDVACSAVW